MSMLTNHAMKLGSVDLSYPPLLAEIFVPNKTKMVNFSHLHESFLKLLFPLTPLPYIHVGFEGEDKYHPSLSG